MIAANRIQELLWILLDVDGVLTDGRLVYGPRGEEVKIFDVRDGLALKLAQRAGLRVGLLSGRRSQAVLRRAEELGLDEVLLGEGDKGRAFDRFLERRGLTASQVAYAGDDLPDLPVFDRGTLSFAPQNAAPELLAVASHRLERSGGRGAVREMVELLLRSRGDWDSLVQGLRHTP